MAGAGKSKTFANIVPSRIRFRTDHLKAIAINRGDSAMRYHVPLFGQQTDTSCWATSIAMILSWARRTTVSPDEIRQLIG